MRGNETKSNDLNAAVSEHGTFDGILASYNNVDLGGDLIEPGAFSKTIAENNGVVPLLWQHKTDFPIGTLTLIDSTDGLRVQGKINLELRQGYEAYVSLKDRIIKGLSIGYDTVKSAFDGPVRRLKELRLWEGSIVTFGMDTHAIVMSVKAAHERKDYFAEELAEAQLAAGGYQMMNALSDALYETVYDMQMTPAEKLAMARTSIQQFSEAFLAWMPEFLQYLTDVYAGDMKALDAKRRERKAGREISAANMQKIKTAHEHITGAADLLAPLCEAEAVLENGNTSAAKAGRESKPEALHLAATLERMRAFVRVA